MLDAGSAARQVGYESATQFNHAADGEARRSLAIGGDGHAENRSCPRRLHVADEATADASKPANSRRRGEAYRLLHAQPMGNAIASEPELDDPWCAPAQAAAGGADGVDMSVSDGQSNIPPTSDANASARADVMSQYSDDGYRGAPDKPLEDSIGNSLIGGAGSRLVSGLGFVGRLIAGQISRAVGKRS